MVYFGPLDRDQNEIFNITKACLEDTLTEKVIVQCDDSSAYTTNPSSMLCLSKGLVMQHSSFLASQLLNPHYQPPTCRDTNMPIIQSPPLFLKSHLFKVAEWLYTGDYRITYQDIMRNPYAQGPSCKACLNHVQLLTFHLEIFQDARRLGMVDLQKTAMRKFAAALDIATWPVLRILVMDIYGENRFAEAGPGAYQLAEIDDFRAYMIVNACFWSYLRNQMRFDMIRQDGWMEIRDGPQNEMYALRKMIPDFDVHMAAIEKVWLVPFA